MSPDPSSTTLLGTRRHRLKPQGKVNGLLAFSGGNPDLDAVYTVNQDGSRLRRLPLPAALGPTAVAWSPGGRRIPFAAVNLSAHEESNLYVMQANGHRLRQLTNALLAVADLTWSPDGRWIAFAGFVHADPAAFIIRASGTGLHPILPRFKVGSLAWGPEGRLAIAGIPAPVSPNWRGSRGIWTVNVNGSHPRRIVGPLPLPHAVGSPLSVQGWSPDGRSLLIQNAPRYGDISTVRTVGGHPQVILHCPFQTCTVVPGKDMGGPAAFKNYINSVAWSPDGRTIVFTVGSGASWRLYTVWAHGSGPHSLGIPGGPSNIGGISWQPLAPVPEKATFGQRSRAARR
jgi:Tol biopolymer transport system component